MGTSMLNGAVENLDWTKVAQPSAELVRFAEDASANQRPYDGAERRSEIRRSIAINVLVQPIDDQDAPHGAPFIAVTRDISTSGLAMFYDAPVAEKRLLVEFDDFAGGHCRMVMEVLRCVRVKGFYEIAGKFLTRLTD